MRKLIVIGYGEPCCGDAGIGFHAAAQFENTNHDHANVDVIAAPELRPQMAEAVSRADIVVFIHATRKGAPGTVWGVEISPRAQGEPVRELTPEALLAATRAMYGRFPEAVFISISGETFDYGSMRTPKVDDALPKVFRRIEEIVAAAKARENYHAPAEQAGV